MDFPSRAPVKINPRPDFRPDDFRKLMFHRGMDVVWEQAQECPCRRRAEDFAGDRFSTTHLSSDNPGTTTEARPDCEMCKGGGYFYHSPQSIKALVTKASSTPEAYSAWGAYARGMSYFTLLPEHLPSLFDRIKLVNSAMLFRESRVRTGASLEALRYPIVSRQLDLATGITSVDVLHVQSSTSTGLTTSANTLVKGVDYQVTDGKLDFSIGGSPPAEGTRFSASYYVNPRYVVVDHPHTNRDTFVKRKTPDIKFQPLPVQCVGKLDFLGDS